MKPSTRIKIATRVCRRRRVGWAALRALRRGARKALEAHRRACMGASPYEASKELEQIRRAYKRALRELLERFPALLVVDPRGEP